MAKFIVILVAFICVFSFRQPSATAQVDNILQLFDIRQALMIRIERPAEIVNRTGELDFFEHPSVIELMEYFRSEEFALLANEANFRLSFREDQTDEFVGWDAIVSGPVVGVVTLKRRRSFPTWVVTFETKQENAPSLIAALCKSIGLDGRDVVDNFDKSEFREIEMYSLTPYNATAFFWHQRCFICSSLSSAKMMVNRLHGEDLPKRSFLTNRKFAAGKQAVSQKDNPVLAQLFFDPELCKRLLPSVPADFWNLVGADMISGIVLEVRQPKNIGTKSANVQISVDGWAGIRIPATGPVSALLESPGISVLPDVSVTDEPIEVFALNINPQQCFSEVSKQFDEMSETVGASKKILNRFEKTSGFRPGFVESLIDSLKGTFMTATSMDAKTPPVVVCEINNRQQARTVISQIQKQSFAQTPLKERAIAPSEEQGIDYWVWNQEEIKQYSDHLVSKIRRGQKNFKVDSYIQPTAFSLSDQYAAMGISSQIEQLAEIQPVEAENQQMIGDFIECVYRYNNTLKRPNLIWMTSPEYWQTHVATMNYHAKLDARVTKLRDVKKFDLVREQVLIRVADAACATLGQMIAVGKAKPSSIRMAVLMFSKHEQENSAAKGE